MTPIGIWLFEVEACLKSKRRLLKGKWSSTKQLQLVVRGCSFLVLKPTHISASMYLFLGFLARGPNHLDVPPKNKDPFHSSFETLFARNLLAFGLSNRLP